MDKAEAERLGIWLRSERRHEDAERAALRRAWIDFHRTLQRTHESLAEDHRQRVRELEEPRA